MANSHIEVDFGTWRDVIASAHGPAQHTTRLLLLVLSLYMNPEKSWCFPSQRALGVRAGLSERAVREHLKLAQAGCWIDVRPGRGRGHEYVATIPAEFEHLVKDELAKSRQPANGAASSPVNRQNMPVNRQSVPVQPANRAGPSGTDCRLILNLNSGVNTPSEFLRRRRGSERPVEPDEDRRGAKAALQSIRDRLDLRRAGDATDND